VGEGAEAAAGTRRGWLARGQGLLQLLYYYRYCIGEEWVRVRRLLLGHGVAGWPEAGPAAAIVLFVLHRRRVGEGVEAAAGTRRAWLA
jgi:hypothetical protein